MAKLTNEAGRRDVRGRAATRAVCGLVLLVTVFAACGGGAGQEAARPAGGAPGSGETGAPVVGAETSPTATSPAAKQGTAGRATPDAIPTYPVVGAEDFPLDVKVSPACGSIGTRMTATVITAPKAKVSIVIAYRDAKDRGQKGFFDADEKGRYIYDWVVPPDAPSGRGGVLASASDGAGHGNGGFWPFEIKDPGRC